MTSDSPPPHEEVPAEPTLVMAMVLLGIGLPATAAAAAFAFGGPEHLREGVFVAMVVWAVGVGVSVIQPLRTGTADGSVMPPQLRWGLAALAVAALAGVVASSAPVLPWTLVLVVGPFFAWVTGSLWMISREHRPTP